MNWESIGAISEAVGAVAVVVTLLFLAVQLRQNTRAVRKAYRSQITETVSNSISVMQKPEFARVMVKVMNNPEALELEEKLMFGSFMLRILRIWEDAYFQWIDGDYIAEAWNSNRTYMLDTLSIPELYGFFETRKAWLDTRFVAYVETELKNHNVKVSLEYVNKSVTEEATDDSA